MTSTVVAFQSFYYRVLLWSATEKKVIQEEIYVGPFPNKDFACTWATNFQNLLDQINEFEMGHASVIILDEGFVSQDAVPQEPGTVIFRPENVIKKDTHSGIHELLLRASLVSCEMIRRSRYGDLGGAS